MPGRPRLEPVKGQEFIDFDGPLVITRPGFDLVQAKEAALHRRRRNDELALTPRTRGFLARTGGLWVPHSGTENTAVVNLPENQVQQTRSRVKEIVYKKYEESDVPASRLRRWANFAGQSAANELRDTFSRYAIDATEGYRRINAGLGRSGEIVREAIEQNEVALKGVASYLMYLQTFIGAPAILGKGERRKWPQARHHIALAKRRDWAMDYLDALPDHDFTETVKEAYYSERSRSEFWLSVRAAHARDLDVWHRRHGLFERPLPIDAYADDPRAYDSNYVDDEYVG